MNNNVNNSEVLATLEDRRLGYVFLSQVYGREVTADFLGKLVSAQGLDAGLEEFAKSISEQNLEEVETDLAAEYAGLFLNMRAFAVAPYESVYTSQERLLMQEARDEVLAEYRSEGLDKTKEFNEPEDHIAIELEFMAFLCQKTIDLIQAGDGQAALDCLNKQKSFLENHLLNWVPSLCDDIDKLTQHEFYRIISSLTREYLESEKEFLEELIKGESIACSKSI